ncbi:hypothetical protein [Mycoplasma putrefaciens]|uniref:hypothetical protein n=1 Tax=Mycoplasma putrefaciens TaxID=2123 RepID=UPI001E62D67C|nr:hypothetical protein [Mycoplasma putrefaciens]
MILSFIKFSKIFTTSSNYKEQLWANEVKKVIEDNTGVNNFYNLEILYKKDKTTNLYINSGFEIWIRAYQWKLSLNIKIMSIIKFNDENFLNKIIGYTLIGFMDYFTRRIMFLRNRKLVKFEDYSILVNGSKQITFDEIGEYLISNYLYYVDRNIKKIFPKQG